MGKREFYYEAADGVGKIHAIEWAPEGEPVCILQIVHGMAEYVDRYDRFARYLNENGFLVVGHDHSGHGKSVRQGQPYGYFYKEDALDKVLKDVDSLRRQTSEAHLGAPYIILGHSMGSFILRCYLQEYADGLAGAIIMGTGLQTEEKAEATRALLCQLLQGHSDDYVSVEMSERNFGSQNRQIKDAVTECDWLSTDSAEVKKYIEDPLCGFPFTLNGYMTMNEMSYRMLDQEKQERVPKALPLLVTSGEEDPVGGMGEGVRQVYRQYQALGIRDVTLMLYPGDRHEILNERDRSQVFADILAWMKSRLSA